MAAYSCILSNKASNVSYQALEDSQLIIFDYDLLKKFSLSDIEVAQSIIVIMEELLRQTIERIAEFAILNPEQRYMELLQNNPAYIQRAPQQDLASYIGITPVSFSRLKSRVKAV
jgi:CRP-like cAMP-binding protein